jgi:hypothetical protein
MNHPWRKATSLAVFTAAFGALSGAAAQQPAPPAPIAGTYSLAQVDKADLPILIAEKDGCRQEMIAAKITLTAENKYTFEATIRESCGEKVQENTRSEQGAVAVSGANLTFTPDAPAEAAAPAAPAQAAGNKVAAEKPAPAAFEFTPLAAGSIADGALTITMNKQSKTLTFRR